MMMALEDEYDDLSDDYVRRKYEERQRRASEANDADATPRCDNCGAPTIDGWVVTVGATPNAGAELTSDGACVACGAPFWGDGRRS
jgi:hypothetical protein